LGNSNLVRENYDVAVANISAKVIVDLSQSLAKLVKVGGRIILSGILKESLSNVEMTLASLNIEIDEVRHDSDWVAILGHKH